MQVANCHGRECWIWSEARRIEVQKVISTATTNNSNVLEAKVDAQFAPYFFVLLAAWFYLHLHPPTTHRA